MKAYIYQRVLKEYILLFFKMIISSKITFLWYLILPTALFFFSHYNWFLNKPQSGEFYFQFSVFIAYIIFVLSLDASVSLIRLRETGAFKVFKFISGSKYVVIWAQVLTQIMTMIMACLIFSGFIGIIFIRNPIEFVMLISVVLLVVLITALPLSLFFLSLLLLPIKQESLITILNIIILCFFLISANNFKLPDKFQIIMLIFNPLEVIRQIIFELSNVIIQTSIPVHSFLLTMCILIVYLIIGVSSMPYIKVSSITQRT